MSLALTTSRMTRWLVAVVALALVATVLALGAGVDNASAQDTITCYAIADGNVDDAANNEAVPDTLVRIDDALGGAPDGVIVATLDTTDAEAMAIRPGAGPNHIWAWDTADGLVVINPATGAQQAAPFSIPGKVEGLTWANVDDADLANDVLYAIQTNGDVFGYNAAGTQIFSANVASAGFPEGADIAWDPSSDTLYAVRTETGDTTELVVVGGAVSGTTEFDLEGLGFTAAGQMIGTSGNDGLDSLHTVNKANGATAVLLDLGVDPGVFDHEDVDCLDLEFPTAPGVITAVVSQECVANDGKITATVTYASGDDPVDYTVAITGQADQTGTISSGDAPAMVMSANTLADAAYTVTVTNNTDNTQIVSQTETIACDQAPAIPSASIQGECVNNDGKITVNLANTAAAGAASVEFVVTVAGQAAVTSTVAPGGTDNPMFTGLADGNVAVTVTADGTEILSESVPVTCDQAPAQPSAAILDICENDDGKLTISVANGAAAGAEDAVFTITVGGQAPIMTTVAPGGTDNPMFTGLADGTYSVNVVANGVTLLTQQVTIDCDPAPTPIPPTPVPPTPVPPTPVPPTPVPPTPVPPTPVPPTPVPPTPVPPTPVPATGTIGNRFWVDTNANGAQDPNEPGINGATITLLDMNGGVVTTTTTSGSGNYSFTGVPAGMYFVRFTDPSGRAFTLKDTGADNLDSDANTDGVTDKITLAAGQTNNTIDAGVTNAVAPTPVPPTPVPPTPVPPTPVPPTPVPPTPVPPTPVPPADNGVLGNRLWEDTNGNGQQDPNEPGISSATVNLWTSDAAGNPLAQVQSTTTNAQGQYEFTGVSRTQTYVVQFVAPGRTFTVANTGSDITDSDAGANGITGPVTLGSAITNRTIDAGVAPVAPPADEGVLGNRLWEDSDSNGQQDPNEPGISGATVNLWTSDAAGNPVAQVQSTTTNAQGQYEFTGVSRTQTYVVQFVAPGRTFTVANTGSDVTDSDVDAAGISDPVTLAGAITDRTIDAGVTPVVGPTAVPPTPVPATPVPATPVPATPVPPTAVPAPNTGVLGNRLWVDTNQNGQQDPNEPGVNGATVNLWTATAAGAPLVLVQSTTTAGSGQYEFVNVDRATTYVVEFVAPGFTFTTTNVGSDNTDSDADAAGISDPVMLGGAITDRTIDAGVVPSAPPADEGVLGNRLWVDTNQNGQQDPNEPGVNGATVNLWTSDAAGAPIAQVQTTTTNAQGQYEFTGVSRTQTYVVQFVAPGRTFTVVNTGSDVTDSDVDAAGISDPVTLGPVKTDRTIDAGVTPEAPAADEGVLGNRLWEDTDGDGQQDPNEPGISGATVNLWTSDAAGAPIAQVQSTTTNSRGQYEFTGVSRTQTYVVQFVAPGRVFTDVNVGPDNTDSDADANGISDPITLGGAKTDRTIDAGVEPLAAPPTPVPAADGVVGNRLWTDTNGNGVQDANEPGVNGATVELWTSDAAGNPVTLLQTTTTAGSGQYEFTNVNRAATHVVRFSAPGATFTTANAGGNDNLDSDVDAAGVSDPFVLGTTITNRTIDAGVAAGPAPVTGNGVVGNRLWEDTNGNGQQDPNEPGINGATVILWTVDAAGNLVNQVQTTTTAGSGNFTFTGLSRTQSYAVEFVVPGRVFGVQDSGPDATDNDANAMGVTAPFVLGGAITNNTIDGAVAPEAVIPPAPVLDGVIGNRLWVDTNSNGVQDVNEPGLNGATVELWTSDAAGNPLVMIQTTTTAGSGQYEFVNVDRAGTYVVRYVAPGRTFTVANAGANDVIDSDADANGVSDPFTLGGTKTNRTIDAGVAPLVAPPNLTGTIGNRLWEDTDGDGQQDPNEPGVQGATVKLWVVDAAGVPQSVVQTTTTDNKGNFSFTNVDRNEDYVVEYIVPGRVFTIANQGSDQTDSDVSAAGLTSVIDLSNAATLNNVDAGVAPAVAAPPTGVFVAGMAEIAAIPSIPGTAAVAASCPAGTDPAVVANGLCKITGAVPEAGPCTGSQIPSSVVTGDHTKTICFDALPINPAIAATPEIPGTPAVPAKPATCNGVAVAYTDPALCLAPAGVYVSAVAAIAGTPGTPGSAAQPERCPANTDPTVVQNGRCKELGAAPQAGPCTADQVEFVANVGGVDTVVCYESEPLLAAVAAVAAVPGTPSIPAQSATCNGVPVSYTDASLCYAATSTAGAVSYMFLTACKASGASFILLVTNPTSANVATTMDVTGLATKNVTIAANSDGYISRTGRPDGTYAITATINGATVVNRTEVVDC